jgi:hypothetical protein
MPSQQPDPEALPLNGLICFLSNDRPCGPDCMAFDAAPEGADYKDKQWANCMLLVNAHRAGKHLIVLASVGAEMVRRAKTEAADHARTNQPAPPKVT